MSQREEVERFRLKFNTRYQSSLGFQPAEFEDTINSVLKCPVEERGILAIYLHNENHVAADKFAVRITRAQIAEYLNENFILWGFDSNAECIQQSLKDNLINYDLRRANNMPVLLIVVRFNDTNEIISTITVETNQILAELENCYEEFSRRKAELLRQVDLREFERLNFVDRNSNETPEELIENEEQERKSIDIFGMQFNNRYNVNLRFQTITFNETANNVLKCSIADRGVLAIYLHDDNHVFVHLFAKRIAESQIAEYLNEHFNIYGFDCTSQNNKNYMLQLLRKNLINYDLNFLPVLLIVGRFNGSNQIMSIITVNTRNIRERLENSNNEFESRNAENYSFR